MRGLRNRVKRLEGSTKKQEKNCIICDSNYPYFEYVHLKTEPLEGGETKDGVTTYPIEMLEQVKEHAKPIAVMEFDWRLWKDV